MHVTPSHYHHDVGLLTLSTENACRVYPVESVSKMELTGPFEFMWLEDYYIFQSHKLEWRGALMFALICVWINGWVNNREAGDLRRYRTHYDVTVMIMKTYLKALNF